MSHRNIVVILCDALRYDVLREPFMPNVSKLCEKGFVFTNAHTMETCTERSMPYLLCGQSVFSVENSIAMQLSSKGYFSHLITTNDIVYSKFSYGWDKKKYQPPIKYEGNFKKAVRKIRKKFAIICLKNLPMWMEALFLAFKENLPLPYTPSNELLKITEKEIGLSPQPWFMWIHLMDTHLPYYPLTKNYSKTQLARLNVSLERYLFHHKAEKIKHITGKLRRLYADSANEMDYNISKFIEKRGNDIIILTSDHGELFGEGGYFVHPNKMQHIKEATHVPLIIWGLGKGENNNQFNMNNFPKLIQTCLGIHY